MQGSEDAEEPCPPGTTSLARSTSESSCTGPTPHISQVHVSYTGKPGELSVDFVALSKGAAYAYTSFDNATWARVPAANTFSISTIGHLSQALLQWPGVKAGQTVFYKVGNTEANSTVFPVTPIVARPEVFAGQWVGTLYWSIAIDERSCLPRAVAMIQRSSPFVPLRCPSHCGGLQCTATLARPTTSSLTR